MLKVLLTVDTSDQIYGSHSKLSYICEWDTDHPILYVY